MLMFINNANKQFLCFLISTLKKIKVLIYNAALSILAFLPLFAPVFTQLSLPVIKTIAHLAQHNNVELYLVGGYVRDMLLERNSKDIDIVVIGDGIAFAQMLTNHLPVSDFAVFKNYGTAMVKTPELEIEFVGARKESYARNSRKPSVTPGSLTDDQLRRDFTINALAISLNQQNFGELIDPFGGLTHLKAKTIKTPLAPDKTFDDDPLRMLRAIRFAAQLDFTIDDDTFNGIVAMAKRIDIISKERVSDELNKIIKCKKPSIGFKLLFKSGLLKLIFPELHAMHGVEVIKGKAHKDNFYHTLQVLDNVCTETDNLWLRWATLLHDIGKPPTKRFIESEGGWTFHGHEDKGSRMVTRIFKNLKLPLNEKLKYVEKLVAMHHRPKVLANEGITDSAIRRLIVDAGDDLDDLFTLCRADMTSSKPEKIALYRSNLIKVQALVQEVAERDALRNWQPPISGELIMETFGIGPSKPVGIIKTAIREAILDGQIPNAFEPAFELMIDTAKQLNLKPVK